MSKKMATNASLSERGISMIEDYKRHRFAGETPRLEAKLAKFNDAEAEEIRAQISAWEAFEKAKGTWAFLESVTPLDERRNALNAALDRIDAATSRSIPSKTMGFGWFEWLQPVGTWALACALIVAVIGNGLMFGVYQTTNDALTTLTDEHLQLKAENDSLQPKLAAIQQDRTILQEAVDFIVTGRNQPTKRAEKAMANLHRERTQEKLFELRNAPEKHPIPIAPVLTAVRTLNPMLQWESIGENVEYQITVTDQYLNRVWKAQTAESQVEIPTEHLKRGESYFWQVKATVEGESRLSPFTGFWVLDDAAWQEVQTVEQAYPDNPFVRVSVYAKHGLYADAHGTLAPLAADEKLKPIVREMLDNLNSD